MADEETRTPDDTSADFESEDSGAEDQYEETEGGDEGGESEPRSYSEEEREAYAQDQVKKATSAVQSAKDRRISSLEAQINALQSAEPIPQFKDANEELRWHRERTARAQHIRSTEARIASSLAELSDKLGIEIKRDDERLEVSSPESFAASLRAIEREEALRAKIPDSKKGSADKGKAPARKDAHRYDGGSSGTRTTYDPKKYENTGNVYEALRAKSQAQGHSR